MKLKLIAILTLTVLSVQMSGFTVFAQQQPLTAKVTIKRDGIADRQVSVIASGAPFETTRDVEAEINFPPVGKIKVFPSARVLPMFDAKSISVIVRDGCASLFVEKGYSGSLTRPDGTVRSIEAGKAAEVNSCDRVAGTVGGSGGSGAGAGGAAGGIGAGTGISSSVLAAIVIASGALGAVLWTVVFKEDLPGTVSPSR